MFPLRENSPSLPLNENFAPKMFRESHDNLRPQDARFLCDRKSLVNVRGFNAKGGFCGGGGVNLNNWGSERTGCNNQSCVKSL